MTANYDSASATFQCNEITFHLTLQTFEKRQPLLAEYSRHVETNR